MILLIDCNNFFVSCERVFKANLINKPVVVAGGQGGCVIARSNEAKALGIPMGAPLFKVRDIIKNHNVHVCYTNFSLYNDLHCRIMSLVKKNFPTVEVYSIDEAFIDFKGFKIEQAQNIHDVILRGVGISTSIGIAQTKTLSKIANHIAKKKGLPYFVLDDKNSVDILGSFPVEDIWGVGKAISSKLKSSHINSALELRNTDPRRVRQTFGVVGERIVRELNGLPCFNVDVSVSLKKSIQVSRSFVEPVTSLEILKQALSKHTENLCVQLRQQNTFLKTAIVYMESSPFRTPFISDSQTISFDHPTQDPSDVLKQMNIEALFKKNVPYKKTGITAIELTKTPTPRLFAPKPKNTNALKALDAINQRFGNKTIHLLSSGFYQKNDRSYTTCWEDLLVVR